MIEAGKMQVTLVSHYGEKPDELEGLIRSCQELLSFGLAARFRPYPVEQVHGTIIGLEGHRKSGRLLNRNSGKQVHPKALLRFLREQFPVIEIRIGGYRHRASYGFQSRGTHPYFRSFSIQGKIAVAMGWPVQGDTFPNSIDDLRWRFSRDFGVRHKWHKTKDAVDNDFFLVLGRVEESIDRFRLDHAVTEVRTFLSGLEGVHVRIEKDTLRVVAYMDDQLPPETSWVFSVDDPLLTSDRLLAYYPMSDGG
jgi:hypothetical protein